MDRMAEHFRPDAWSLLLVDEAHNDLYFSLAAGGAADSLRNVRLKLGEGIAGWVAKHGECLIVPDVYTDPRFAKRIDEMTRWQTRSIICVPLKAHQKVIGVVQLINVEQDAFNDHELFLLQSLCDNAAAAIESARELENRDRAAGRAEAAKSAE